MEVHRSRRAGRRLDIQGDVTMAELKNIRIAVSGVYDYAREEVMPMLHLPLPGQGAPDWVEDKKVYKVYRPATVLEAAKDKFKMLPLTHHHPNVAINGQNFQKYAMGYTGETPWVDWIQGKNEVGIRSTVMIYDDEALDAYYRGEIQLSPGYVAEFAWQKGTAPDGQEYDIIMKEIKDVNHLALLPYGRGGTEAVVLDHRRTIFDEVKETLAKDAEWDESKHQRDDAGKFSSGSQNGEDDENDIRKGIKKEFVGILNKPLPNDATGESASISSTGLNKMLSGKAIAKSYKNGFSRDQHFEAVGKIVDLYKKARLIKEHPDKNGAKNVTIKRFVAQDTLKDGTDFDALITVKETIEHGRRIYSLELDEINKASKKWMVNDDGTLTPENKPSTGSPNNIVTQKQEKVKSIFDLVRDARTCSIFDLVRNPLVRDSLTWSGHKLQGRRKWNGLDISIENRKGSVRRGTDPDGHEWAITMKHPYGYIRGTEGTDGDHLDCYLGEHEDAPQVFIIHQNNPDTGKYDEDKVMLGFLSWEEAKNAYMEQYDRPGFFGGMDTMTLDEFLDEIRTRKNKGKKISMACSA